jgi:hypothetical protein
MENRHFVHIQKEHGGNLAFDFRRKRLIRGDLGTGKYNRIEMSRGVVDWHSHPRRCLNNNTCALGLPSPMDLGNIILGSIYGTSAHMVYAAEGTYVLQVKAPVLRIIRDSPQALGDFIAFVMDRFERLHRRFIRTHMKYNRYRMLWLEHANASGLHARLFKGDKTPKIRIFYDCHLRPSLPRALTVPMDPGLFRVLPRVRVPLNEEDRFLGHLNSGRGPARTAPNFLASPP